MTKIFQIGSNRYIIKIVKDNENLIKEDTEIKFIELDQIKNLSNYKSKGEIEVNGKKNNIYLVNEEDILDKSYKAILHNDDKYKEENSKIWRTKSSLDPFLNNHPIHFPESINGDMGGPEKSKDIIGSGIIPYHYDNKDIYFMFLLISKQYNILYETEKNKKTLEWNHFGSNEIYLKQKGPIKHAIDTCSNNITGRGISIPSAQYYLPIKSSDEFGTSDEMNIKLNNKKYIVIPMKIGENKWINIYFVSIADKINYSDKIFNNKIYTNKKVKMMKWFKLGTINDVSYTKESWLYGIGFGANEYKVDEIVKKIFFTYANEFESIIPKIHK